MRTRNLAVVLAVALTSVAFEVSALAASSVSVERAEGMTVYNSDPVKTAIAKCQSGQVALSAWAVIDGGEGQVMLKAVFTEPSVQREPHRPDKAIAIAAEEPSGTKTVWRLRAFAICASDLPHSSTDWVKVSTALNSDNPKSATAMCGDDKVVVGSGGAVFSGGGAAFLTGFFPSGKTQVTAKASATAGIAHDWDLAVYATCADRSVFDGLLTVPPSNSVSAGEDVFVSADCPARTSVISGGGEIIVLGRGQAMLRGVLYEPALAASTSVVARAQAKKRAFPRQWGIRTYAICAANVLW